MLEKNPNQYNGEAITLTQEGETEQLSSQEETHSESQKWMYLESYGCQMNFSDSEIVASILVQEGYLPTKEIDLADLILINTCSIREKAEQTTRHRLDHFKSIKQKKPEVIIGVLGCMAERLKSKLLDEEKIVDLVLGPDAYKDLPKLLRFAEAGERSINTFLSKEETYADISPFKLDSNGVTAFISIMRGCDNMCSFCVVPFTRGRERSRNAHTIVNEAKELFERGFREVTLLGQNVDSYKWSAEENNKKKLEKTNTTDYVNFATLLKMVASIHPDLRVRFSTSHPKDMTDEVLYAIKAHENICKYIHLPLQSGSSRVLDLMNRTYDRPWYINRIKAIRKILGEECGISADIISGFCSETEEEHNDTKSLMEWVKYDFAYMFSYSERPGTPAAKNFQDDIPNDIKKKRLQEIIKLQKNHSLYRNNQAIGKTYLVLVEGKSKKSDAKWQGRNSANKVVVFEGDCKKGAYYNVKITSCTSGTLLGNLA